jgi:cytochrome c553
VRDLVATVSSPEAVGVALVTLAREGEFEECPLGLLDRMPECKACEGSGKDQAARDLEDRTGYEGACVTCHGSGVKPTGTWLISPWLPSARNVTEAARTLAKSKRT